MTALNGPESFLRPLLLLLLGAVADAGVDGREVPLMVSAKEVIPPSRSVAVAEACTCEPAIRL